MLRPGRARSAHLALVVAALANCSFALAAAVGSRLPPGRAMVSELSVAGQPGAWLFRLGDAVAGAAALTAAGLLAGTTWRPLRACVAGFGVGTLVSALVPLTCAPTATPGCPVADRTVPDVVHDAVSVVGTAAALVGAWLLWWSWRHARAGLLALAVAALATALGVAQASFVLPALGDGAGRAQRLQIVLVSAWLVLLVVGADPARRRPVHPPVHPTG